MGTFKGTKHELTHADSIKGGKRRTLRKKLSRRKTCNEKCPIFNECPLATFGLKYNECYLNSSNPNLRNFIIKIINGDKEDALSAMTDIISDMARITYTEDDFSIKNKKIVLDSLARWVELKYGTKQKIEHTGKISFEEFREIINQNEINTADK